MPAAAIPAAPITPAAHPLPSRLPISRQALSALDRLRTSQPSLSSSLCRTVLTAALQDGTEPTAPALCYVTRRLLTGLSVSAGSSRLNYAAAFAALSRALIAKNGRSAAGKLLGAVRDLYGKGGSFSLGYAGAERERALGTLAALSAVLAATEPSSLSATSAREVVSLLRFTVDGDPGKWRLGAAAVRIVRRLVKLVKKSESEAAVKPMWLWCTDRREKCDGLEMAFMLYHENLVSAKALRGLYPSLDDAFITALLDTFEGGFPTYKPQHLQVARSPHDETNDVVPYGWLMVVKYVMSEKGSSHLGSISEFWRAVVVEKLVKGSRSGEKKLLALELIPVVLNAVDTVECFDSIFNSHMASLIATILGTRRDRRQSVSLRKGRTADDVLSHLVASAETLGAKMLPRLRAMSTENVKCRPFVRAFLLWCVRGGILYQVLPPALFQEAIEGLSDAEMASLFSAAVAEFSRPRNDGQDAGEFKEFCNTTRRPNILRFIFALAKSRSTVASDAVRVVTLYTTFKEDREGSRRKSASDITFSVYRNDSGDSTYGGLLPCPVPALSARVVSVGFRRLIDFLAQFGNKDKFTHLPLLCLGTINDVLAGNALGLQLRCALVQGSPADDQNSDKVAQMIADTHMQIRRIPETKDMLPLSRALALVTTFMSLQVYQPSNRSGDSSSEETRSRTIQFVTFFERVQECCSNLIGNDSRKSLKNTTVDGEEEEVPEPVEMITHLITELCGRDAASFRLVSTVAIESLGSALDDKVVAVIFDAMDSYLLGDDDVDQVTVVDNRLHNDDAYIDDVDDDSGLSEEGDSDDEEDKVAAEREDALARRDGTSSLQGKDNDDAITADVDASNDVRSSDEEASDDEVNMDIDNEDPAVLAEFDRRLGTHLRLLKDEKKLAQRKKLKSEFRYTQVSRLLLILETVARAMRMRLEKSEDSDGRLPLVFMDLHVRLYEFTLGHSSRIRFLKQAVGIVSKQMSLSPSVISELISDTITAAEITDRFFDVLGKCVSERRVPDSEARTISRSAGFFISVAEAVSGISASKYLPVYKSMLKGMVSPEPHFWTPAMFSSFLQKSPQSSLQLFRILEDALESESMTKNMRSTVAEMILAMSVAANEKSVSKDDATYFWKAIRAVLRAHCIGGAAAKKWKTVGYVHMVQVATNGVKGEHMLDTDSEVVGICAELQHIAIPRKERTKLLKMLRHEPSTSNKRKRSQKDAAERGNSNTIQDPKSNGKKLKVSKR